MSEITIKAKDNSGEFFAYVAEPQTDQPAPAVIVIQEIFGVNEIMREITDSLAQNGYLAICPDLFWRLEPRVELTDNTQEEWDKAFDLMSRFDTDKGVDDLIATLDHARQMKNCNGLVGDIGYCLGGKLAYMMATRSDADCSVSYYGVGIEDMLDEAKNITKPLLMHRPTEDQFVPKDAQNKVQNALESHNMVSYFTYEGNDHAFAREGGDHYDEKAARLANMRTADFLATYLGRDA